MLDLSKKGCKMFAVYYDAVQPAQAIEANCCTVAGDRILFYQREWRMVEEEETQEVWTGFDYANVKTGNMVEVEKSFDTLVSIISSSKFFRIDPIVEGGPGEEDSSPDV